MDLRTSFGPRQRRARAIVTQPARVACRRTPTMQQQPRVHCHGAPEAADAAAVDALLAVRPSWVDLQPASLCCPSLPRKGLLHAGPPLRSSCSPGGVPAPVLNAALAAILYEGWAADEAGARELVRSGSVSFHAAQDHAVVVPLAAVVSPSMLLQVRACMLHNSCIACMHEESSRERLKVPVQNATTNRHAWPGTALACSPTSKQSVHPMLLP